MAVCIYTIPFEPGKEVFHDEELARFLLNKTVRNMKPEFFISNGRPYWTVFIEYDTLLSDVTDKGRSAEIKDDGQRMFVRKLQEWRKERASKDKLPVFIIATNSELIEVAKRAPQTLESLRQIHGFGKKKVERYGKDIISMVKSFYENKHPGPEPSKEEIKPPEPPKEETKQPEKPLQQDNRGNQ